VKFSYMVDSTPASTKFVRSALALVPLLSAIMFFVGAAFHQGYLDGYGIEDSMFPLAPDRTLISGYLTFAVLALKPLLLFPLLGFAVIIVLLIYGIFNGRLRQWVGGFAIGSYSLPNPKIVELDDRTRKLSEQFAVAVLVSLSLFCLSVCFILFGFVALNVGRDQAKAEIELFRVKRSNYLLLSLKGEDHPIKAMQIMCNTTHCAFWLENRSFVIPLTEISGTSNYSYSYLQNINK
jgi:hypothetical protein